MSIEEKQQEIIENFSFLEDKDMRNEYLHDLAKQLPPLADEYKTDDYIIKGCQSKVWLNSELIGDKIHFSADSNTITTKGIIALLVDLLSERTPKEVTSSDIFFFNEIGLGNFLSNQRSTGLGNMIKRMKMDALALSTKTNA